MKTKVRNIAIALTTAAVLGAGTCVPTFASSFQTHNNQHCSSNNHSETICSIGTSGPPI